MIDGRPERHPAKQQARALIEQHVLCKINKGGVYIMVGNKRGDAIDEAAGQVRWSPGEVYAAPPLVLAGKPVGDPTSKVDAVLSRTAAVLVQSRGGSSDLMVNLLAGGGMPAGNSRFTRQIGSVMTPEYCIGSYSTALQLSPITNLVIRIWVTRARKTEIAAFSTNRAGRFWSGLPKARDSLPSVDGRQKPPGA